MLRCRLTSATFLVVVLLATGCQAHVSVFAIDSSAYKATWEGSWAEVSRDVQPLVPTDSSPGVCNIGGDKQACYDASERIALDLQALKRDLEATHIPDEYAAADEAVKEAVTVIIAGFQQRMRAIADEDGLAWRESNATLRTGSMLLQQAYAQFPAVDPPSEPAQL
jgi:hypothetical protein